MLSVHGVGHCKLSVTEILYKRIEAAAVHVCLEHNLAVYDVICIYFDDTNMLSANGSVHKVQLITVHDEIRS